MIGAAALVYIAVTFQWAEIWKVLRQADLPVFLAGSSLAVIFYWLLRSFRWAILIKNNGIEIPFIKVYFYTVLSAGFSIITPFQSGEAFKIELLHKYGGRRATGYADFILERWLDLIVVLILAFISLTAGFNLGVSLWIFYALIFGFILSSIAAVSFIILARGAKIEFLRGWLIDKWNRKGMIFGLFLLTLASWSVVATGWQIALRSLSINLDFIQSAALLSLTTLIGILSFVPGGVGVSEISVTTILTKAGYDSVLAQSGAIAVRGFTVLIVFLAVLHLFLLKIHNIYERQYKSAEELFK